MKVVLSALLVSSVFLLGHAVAHATNGIRCAGTIRSIGVHGTDRVILWLSSMNTKVQICNLNQMLGTTFPISPKQCAAVYSTLLTAFAMGKSVDIYFDNVQIGTSCTTFDDWEIATARWVHLDEW